MKQEIVKMERCREQQTLAAAFRDASEDPERLEVFLSSGTSGLDKDSKIMLDQLRSIDKKRLVSKIWILEHNACLARVLSPANLLGNRRTEPRISAVCPTSCIEK